MAGGGRLPAGAPSTRSAPALAPVEAQMSSAGEDPEARGEWFTFQRLYPHDSIPADARRRAWESRERERAERPITAAAEQRWEKIGPLPTQAFYGASWGVTSGRINAVAISPANPQLVLVGSSTGGIWRSTDGGASFTPTSDDQVDLAVGSIAFSKSNPSVVYAGMGDSKLGYLGSGVLKSTDAGRSWQRASNNSLPSPGTVTKIEVDSADSDRVYVAQYSRLMSERVATSGLYLSTDGGMNWRSLFAGPARDFAIHASNRQTLYLGVARGSAMDNSPAAGLYRSTDGGQSWAHVLTTSYDQYRTRDVRIAVTPADPQTVYAYTGGFNGPNFGLRVVLSTDGGVSWADRGTAEIDVAQFGYNSYIVAHPADENTVYVGTRDLYRSTDGGARWVNLTRNFSQGVDSLIYTPAIANTHPDQHALALSATNPGVIYLGNDGGLSKSNDGGNSFQSLNWTLSLTQMTSIALHPTDPSISYCGTQDNGTQRRVSGSAWAEFISGDGGRVVINPLGTGTVMTNYFRGNIYRFYDDGRIYDKQIAWSSTFGEPDDGRIAFYPPFTGNGVDATLYFGSWRLFVSTDVGETWVARALDLTKGVNDKGRDVLTAIGVSRSNPNVIYTGSSQGRAMTSTDGGFTWRDVTPGLPDRFISGVTVDPSDHRIAYVTVSGFGTGHVFMTTDGGAAWSDVSGDLPDIPANALLTDPKSPATLYVGTDIGVFRTTNGGARWNTLDRGMPPVVVTAFASQASGLIQAATYGRGAYEMISDGPETEPPPQRPTVNSASFDGKKKLTIEGTAFGNSPAVFINNADRSGQIKGVSATQVKLKGKAGKLGLVTGENTIKVVDAAAGASNVFVLRL
jgi:photosystem II stability/assembly factor-like uncharacterized protein